MKERYDPERRRRRSMRLEGYDYSQVGAYFLTICTVDRRILFGKVVNHQMVLNEAGRIVADEWLKSARIRAEIELDAWVVMPNHIHGILTITDVGGECNRRSRTDQRSLTTGVGVPGRGDRRVAPTGPGPRSVGAIMAGFKSASARRINAFRDTPGAPVWQRNYYEHVIRYEAVLNRIRQYIAENPARWAEDPENPARRRPDRGGV